MGGGDSKPRKRDRIERSQGKSSGKSPRGGSSKYKKSVGNSTLKVSNKNSKIGKQPKKARPSPTCTIAFSALGYEQLETVPNVENFEQSPIADKADIVYDRGLNYARQINTVVKSVLLKSNDVLDYELDEAGGVAWTAEIPTFNYDMSELNHDIYYKNRESGHVQNVDYRKKSYANGSRGKFGDDDDS